MTLGSHSYLFLVFWIYYRNGDDYLVNSMNNLRFDPIWRTTILIIMLDLTKELLISEHKKFIDHINACKIQVFFWIAGFLNLIFLVLVNLKLAWILTWCSFYLAATSCSKPLSQIHLPTAAAPCSELLSHIQQNHFHPYSKLLPHSHLTPCSEPLSYVHLASCGKPLSHSHLPTAPPPLPLHSLASLYLKSSKTASPYAASLYLAPSTATCSKPLHISHLSPCSKPLPHSYLPPCSKPLPNTQHSHLPRCSKPLPHNHPLRTTTVCPQFYRCSGRGD